MDESRREKTELSNEQSLMDNTDESCRKKEPSKGFVVAVIGLAVVTLVLVLIVVITPPIMSPQAKVAATAISITKTIAAKTGAYVDPDLLIEPLPVENVSGIAILGGLMALIVLGVTLREFFLWRKRKKN